MPQPASSSAPPVSVIGALRFIGPGLILTAGIVGTGELVVTPRVASEHGFTLLWLILLGCLVKVFVQVELGRYAVATGTTTLQALDSMPGPRVRVSWMLWVWLPTFLAMISVIGGILGGTAEVLRTAGLDIDKRLLVVLLGAGTSALLASGRYALVEFSSIVLVALFMFAAIGSVVALQWTPFHITAAQITDGLSFHLPANMATAFAAFGIIGVGAAELMYYPYWCLEKGYAHRVGPRGEGSSEWLARAKGWLRVMRVDAWSSMVVYTTATIAFYLLGAAILHAKGLHVSNKEMVGTLAHMFLETFGAAGLWVFLVGAVATLYSTALAGSASNARLLADALHLYGFARDAGEEARMRRVRWCCVALPLYGAALALAWPEPVTLMLINGVGQAILLPFLGGAALYLRYRRLQPELRPGRRWTLCLWLSAASLAAVGLYQLVDEVLKRLR
jgi:manganese transport protein